MTPAPTVHASPEAGGRAVAGRIRELAAGALRARGRFSIGVSGGASPVPLFEALARAGAGGEPDRVWSVYWCDERLVPPGDARSNFALARRTWLEPARVPSDRVHPVPVELGERGAAEHYESALRAAADVGDGAALDVAVLGVGPDGHTASLFPGRPALQEPRRWVVAEPDPGREPRVARVTLSLVGLASARRAIFLAWGEEKHAILARILGGTAPELPAARVRALESVEWHVDRAAWGGP
ncbi:MAG TPA: 6-phosphogluconolactonase [Thermoplasmata archaeon]|nr:6-phosphogluconolactonase [Thermoplasmata archaeon]